MNNVRGRGGEGEERRRGGEEEERRRGGEERVEATYYWFGEGEELSIHTCKGNPGKEISERR